MKNHAIFALTDQGALLGRRLNQLLEGSDLYLPKRFKGEKDEGVRFFEDLREAVNLTFQEYRGLVLIMATGIVVRTISHLLKGKAEDPAVVVLDEKGQFVISLLSGHLGGANDLTRKIARLIGAKPVITTATDVNALPCIEDMAMRFHLVIEDIDKIKIVNSAIVNGKQVAFIDSSPQRLQALKRVHKDLKNFSFCDSLTQPSKTKTDIFVIITRSTLTPTHLPMPHLTLCPKDIIVGLGCNRNTKAEEFEEVYYTTLKELNLSPLSVRNLATIDVKRDEEGLLKFAEKHNLRIEFYSRNELKAIPLPSGPSENAMKNVGVGGVCEPAALLSSGVEGLLLKKKKARNITIAIAEVPFRGV